MSLPLLPQFTAFHDHLRCVQRMIITNKFVRIIREEGWNRIEGRNNKKNATKIRVFEHFIMKYDLWLLEKEEDLFIYINFTLYSLNS